MSLGHEHRRRSSRAAVQVLVAAPGGGVDVPVVERHRHVARGVCQIPDRDRSSLVGAGGECLHVGDLARDVGGSRQERHRDRIVDVAPVSMDDRIGRVEAVPGDVGCGRVLVGGEGVGIDQDPVSLGAGVVERGQQKVQVLCQRAGDRDLRGPRADHSRHRGCEIVSGLEPARFKPCLHRQLVPLIHPLIQRRPRGNRHQAQRVTREVGDLGDREAVAGRRRIITIGGLGRGFQTVLHERRSISALHEGRPL